MSVIKPVVLVLLLGVCCYAAEDGGRATIRSALSELVSCAEAKDNRVACFIDRAQKALDLQRQIILAEADSAVLAYNTQARATGSSSVTVESPSSLAAAVGKIISELSEILSDSMSSLFTEVREDSTKEVSADDDDDDDEEDDDDDDDNDEKSVEEGGNKLKSENGIKARSSSEERKKKKKKKKIKIHTLIQLIVLGLFIKTKVELLLKVLAVKIAFKFLLVTVGGLLLAAIKLWILAKKSHIPAKVIYYEHAQHQHHYDTGEEDYHSGGGGGSGGSGSWGGWGGWGRSTDTVDVDAHDVAYKGQKPQQTHV